MASCGGGDDSRRALSSCLVLQEGAWAPGVMSDLPQPRYNAATASTSAGTYLLGGPGHLARTSAFLAAGTMDWKEGPRLPLAMNSPCAAGITATSFLVLHGKTVREFDSSEEVWRPEGAWPDLLTSRTDWPGCSVFGRLLVIAGGRDGSSTLQTTEIIDLDSRSVSPGPSMASPRRRFHLVAITGPRLFALGGRSSGFTYLASVEELVNGSWVPAAPLETRRSYYGAAAVPKAVVCA